jgi:hypothetical protein
MRSPEQLLQSMQDNKAKRLQELAWKEKAQLIKLIEQLGHFDSINQDIDWLEQHINKTKMEAK